MTSHSHFPAHVKRFIWILQSSDLVQFRPILDTIWRFTVLEIEQLRICFKFEWRTENGIKDQTLNLSWCLEVTLHALFEFRSISPHIHSVCFKPHFKARMMLDYKNNRPIPFLRTPHVFFTNFIGFGSGRISHHSGSVSRFAVHEIKRFQKSSKFTWRTGNEIKVKILYAFE